MGLFSSNNEEKPIFNKNQGGFHIKVFRSHIECRDQHWAKRSIPISQVANVSLPVLSTNVHIETTGGVIIKVAIWDRKGFRNAIFTAMNSQGAPMKVESTAISTADEIKQFAELKEKGIITEEEFIEKKKKLLEAI